MIFATQLLLEYYVYISTLTANGGSLHANRNSPHFVNTNKITLEEIQHFILGQEEWIQSLNQDYFKQRSLIQKQYAQQIDNEFKKVNKLKGQKGQ